MKVLIGEHVEPEYEHGQLVGYYVHRDYVERPDRPASHPRTQASQMPHPPRRVQIECCPGPDNLFKLVVERQQARARGTSVRPVETTGSQHPETAGHRRPVVLECCPGPENTFALIVQRQKDRGMR